MIWIIIWVIALAAFIMIPILCTPRGRKDWYNRIRYCRCNVSDLRGDDDE